MMTSLVDISRELVDINRMIEPMNREFEQFSHLAMDNESMGKLNDLRRDYMLGKVSFTDALDAIKRIIPEYHANS